MKIGAVLALLCSLLVTSCAIDGPAAAETPTLAGHESALLRVKAALEVGAFLNRDSLTDKKVTQLVGAKATFHPGVDDTAESKSIWWNNARYAGKDLQPTPTFVHGGIFYTHANQLKRPRVQVILTTCVRDDRSCFVDPETVRRVFGAPTFVEEGYPLTPPRHGMRYVPEPTTHPHGNRWMIYEFKNAQSEGSIRFRTLGDGAVLDIHAHYGLPR